MDTRIFHGIFTPVVSPCDDSDGFLYDSFQANIERIFSAGVDGLYVCGGTGDAQLLRVPERKRALELALELAKAQGKRVIAHVGGTFQRDAVELAEHAAAAGAHAVASIPPGGLDQKQTVEYYKALAATGLPVFVYNFPAAMHRTMSLEDLLELLSVPNVTGIKMTDWNLFLMRRVILEQPDAVIYNGYDELVALGLLYGAHGSIGTWSNLFPEMYVTILKLIRTGDANGAVELQKAFIAFLNEAWKYGVIEVFEALMKRKGYAARCFRKPYLSGRVPGEAIPGLLEQMEKVLTLAKEG